MEPIQQMLTEWWAAKEKVLGSFKIMGPPRISNMTGYCQRGGNDGTLCLHVMDHGAGVYGEEVVPTSWRYMHVECAERTRNELELHQPQVEAPIGDDPPGVQITNANLMLVLDGGTQQEMLTLIRLYAGQPVIVTAKPRSERRYDHYVWLTVE